MSLFVKICGITHPEAARTAIEAGVDALGFVLTDSPRQVTPELAMSISSTLPDHVLRVAVFRRPSSEEVIRALGGFIPDLIQADHQCAIEVEGARFLPVYRQGSEGAPDGGRFLYEGLESGAGRLVDMERAAGMARLGEMVLGGGLRPDNVGGVIARVRPFGVDVSSGVESAPGTKDPALIRSFVAAVRAAEERLVSA
jgi:phosphoribosylanthranilate isomerase